MKKCNLYWENGSPAQTGVPPDPQSHTLRAVGGHLGWAFPGAPVPSSRETALNGCEHLTSSQDSIASM